MNVSPYEYKIKAPQVVTIEEIWLSSRQVDRLGDFVGTTETPSFLSSSPGLSITFGSQDTVQRVINMYYAQTFNGTLHLVLNNKAAFLISRALEPCDYEVDFLGVPEDVRETVFIEGQIAGIKVDASVRELAVSKRAIDRIFKAIGAPGAESRVRNFFNVDKLTSADWQHVLKMIPVAYPVLDTLLIRDPKEAIFSQAAVGGNSINNPWYAAVLSSSSKNRRYASAYTRFSERRDQVLCNTPIVWFAQPDPSLQPFSPASAGVTPSFNIKDWVMDPDDVERLSRVVPSRASAKKFPSVGEFYDFSLYQLIDNIITTIALRICRKMTASVNPDEENLDNFSKTLIETSRDANTTPGNEGHRVPLINPKSPSERLHFSEVLWKRIANLVHVKKLTGNVMPVFSDNFVGTPLLAIEYLMSMFEFGDSSYNTEDEKEIPVLKQAKKDLENWNIARIIADVASAQFVDVNVNDEPNLFSSLDDFIDTWIMAKLFPENFELCEHVANDLLQALGSLCMYWPGVSKSKKRNDWIRSSASDVRNRTFVAEYAPHLRGTLMISAKLRFIEHLKGMNIKNTSYELAFASADATPNTVNELDDALNPEDVKSESPELTAFVKERESAKKAIRANLKRYVDRTIEVAKFFDISKRKLFQAPQNRQALPQNNDFLDLLTQQNLSAREIVRKAVDNAKFTTTDTFTLEIEKDKFAVLNREGSGNRVMQTPGPKVWTVGDARFAIQEWYDDNSSLRVKTAGHAGENHESGRERFHEEEEEFELSPEQEKLLSRYIESLQF